MVCQFYIEGNLGISWVGGVCCTVPVSGPQRPAYSSNRAIACTQDALYEVNHSLRGLSAHVLFGAHSKRQGPCRVPMLRRCFVCLSGVTMGRVEGLPMHEGLRS
jgi:hypothetical protein